MNRHSSGVRGIALFLSLLFASYGPLMAVGPAPELPDPGSVSVSKEEQQKLGREVMGQVYQQMPILPDSSPEAQYVRQLGNNLAKVIPQQNSWPFEFHVVQQKEINAFAIPGGPIFVNLGTITSADNEAQLAGVMAHEIAHIYMQHSIKGAQKQGTAQGLGQILGGILGSVIGGTAGAIAQMGAQIGGGLVSMKYSRQDESQADTVGAIIMYKAGYEPRAMAAFFQKLEAEGGSGPQFMSDHPNPGNRVTAVNKQVQNWPPKNFTTNSQQFQQAKQQAQKQKAYTAQEIAQMAKSGQIHNQIPAGVPTGNTAQGTMKDPTWNGVAPSGSFKNFNQAGISIQYPSNWKVLQGQQGQSVTFAPEAGVGGGGIAYGVDLSMTPTQNTTSLDQATQSLAAMLVQSNPGMSAGSIKKIRVNGVDARSVDLQGNSPIQGQRERDVLVVMPGPNGNLLAIVFISTERDYSRLRSTYDRMLQSLRM